MIKYTFASNNNHFRQIVNLQTVNLKRNLSIKEIKEQGYVSVQHNLELLKAMNSPFPHTIAIENDNVIGYVLSMTRDKKEQVPMLKPMIDEIDLFVYNGELMKHQKYVIVGQVCVSKSYRSTGLFTKIYEHHKSRMKPHFDYLVTGILRSNKRSLRAHEKVGFEILSIFSDEEGVWENVICNLNE